VAAAPLTATSATSRDTSAVAGHVFVSYSRTDQDYVDRLVELLRDRGADVWVDHDIDYGTRWASVIQKQVRDCAVMLVVMTPRSEESLWVEREINEAEAHHKRILPLMLEGGIWMRLNNYQAELVERGQMPSERFLAAVVAAAPVVSTPPGNRASPPPLGTQSAAIRRRREAEADTNWVTSGAPQSVPPLLVSEEVAVSKGQRLPLFGGTAELPWLFGTLRLLSSGLALDVESGLALRLDFAVVDELIPTPDIPAIGRWLRWGVDVRCGDTWYCFRGLQKTPAQIGPASTIRTAFERWAGQRSRPEA
jgi:hypothetical protein